MATVNLLTLSFNSQIPLDLFSGTSATLALCYFGTHAVLATLFYKDRTWNKEQSANIPLGRWESRDDVEPVLAALWIGHSHSELQKDTTPTRHLTAPTARATEGGGLSVQLHVSCFPSVKVHPMGRPVACISGLSHPGS